MPLTAPDARGTEGDGDAERAGHCTHCYRDGAFVEPGLARGRRVIEEFAARRLEMPLSGMPLDRATAMVTAFTATLPRWR